MFAENTFNNLRLEEAKHSYVGPTILGETSGDMRIVRVQQYPG